MLNQHTQLYNPVSQEYDLFQKKNGFTLDHFTVSAFINMFGKHISLLL